MTFNPSSYENPETRPFGGFYNDMNSEQLRLHRQTCSMLQSYQFDAPHANRLGEVIGNIIWTGGIFQDKKEVSSSWRQGHYTPFYDEHDSAAEYTDKLGIWYDAEKRLFNVLEWNKVKGVVIRTYAPMTFLKKLYKTFVFNGYGMPEITPNSFQTVIDVLFPDLSKMEVQVWDTPSKMYDYSNIGSCMVGEKYVKFYDTAPCKGLVVMLGDKLVTRCILWTLDNGKRIIGRIYDSTGSGTKLIKNWCKENDVIFDGWDESHVVTCPVSEYGVPYQDNFWYGVRQQDNLVLFNNEDDASIYAHKNKVYGGRTYDLCSTSGNVRALREKLIECHDKSYAIVSDTILQDGVYYNRNTLSSPTAYNLHRFNNDTMVFHPYKRDAVIAAGLLDVVNGEVVVRSECVTLDDGRLAHPSQVKYEVKVVNDKLVVQDTPTLRLGRGDRLLDQYFWNILMHQLAAHLNISMDKVSTLYATETEWPKVEQKVYSLE